jgi:hypothetical protein
MASRQDQLRQVAIGIVAEGSQPSFYQLAARLQREAGASLAEANRTILQLLGRHTFQTTMSGGIVLAGYGGGGGGGGSVIKSLLESVAAILGIIAAVLAIWQGAVFGGALPYPGPLQIIFPTPIPSPNGGGGGGGGVIPTTGPKLAAPHASISGDCDAGYTITWTAVKGATQYQVRVNDNYRATVSGTKLKIPGEQVMTDQKYTVIATALQRPPSEPSNAVTATEC